MIRVFVLIFSVAAAGFMAGFLPAMTGGEAQAQIYLRKGDDGKTETPQAVPKRGSIYLRQDSPEVRSGIYKAREAQETVNIINNDIAALKYWEESGRDPQTVEEIRSYADAYRVRDKIAMLEQRAKILPQIEAENKAHLESVLAAANAEEVPAVDAAGVPAPEAVPPREVTQRSFGRENDTSAQPIYRRNTGNSPPPPIRVFKDYR